MTSTQSPDLALTNTELPLLHDENITRLSRRAALFVKRPGQISKADAEQDAAVILIEMRARFEDQKAAHLPRLRQERLVVYWARLRLIDKYESEFEHQARTRPMSAAGLSARVGGTAEDVRDAPDDKKPRRLSQMDREEIGALVERLPERQRDVVKMLLFEGLTQQEAAARLGVSQPAIHAHYDNARTTLRVLLQPFAEFVK